MNASRLLASGGLIGLVGLTVALQNCQTGIADEEVMEQQVPTANGHRGVHYDPDQIHLTCHVPCDWMALFLGHH